MGKGTEGNPYTKEDLLRRIKRNGGTAEGLDLSGKYFGEYFAEIDLQALNLRGIILEKAVFRGANLAYADLSDANLKGVDLFEAILYKADLSSSNLAQAKMIGTNLNEADLSHVNMENAVLVDSSIKGARLYFANLTGIDFAGTEFSADTDFTLVDWGDYQIGGDKNANEFLWQTYHHAEDTYRRLEIWYTEKGIYDIAGEFFFREMTVRRKSLWINEKTEKLYSSLSELRRRKKVFVNKHPIRWAWSKLISILCGYGEKPERVVISAMVVLFVAAFIYFLVGSTFDLSAFGSSLYFSVVSFTALGYGSWVSMDSNVIRGLGAAESFLGVFMMALFLVTFTRKMTR